jgi:Ca2+-binding EF-hand superfamily protein
MKPASALRIFIASAALAAPAAAQVFNGVDRNGDGVITRNEWRGNNRSFTNYDRDRNGHISQDEMPGSMRRNDRDGYQQRNRSANNPVDKLDKNDSGVVEGYEWPYNSRVFHELDRDMDSVLSSEELRNINTATMSDLDKNNNKRIEAEEWPGGFAQFDRLDENRDGKVSSREYFDRGGEFQRRQRFDDWDKNKDGIISSTEWQSRPNLFHRLDGNRDSQLSWDEFMTSTEQYDRPYGWRDR